MQTSFPRPGAGILPQATEIRFRNDFGFSTAQKIDPRRTIFSQKGDQVVLVSPGGERPRADLCAIWRRKRSKDAFVLIWLRFWSVLEGFWTKLGLFLHDLSLIFTTIFLTTATNR